MSTPDRNFRSYANEDMLNICQQVIDPRESGIDPSIYDDILKLSRCTRAVILDSKIIGSTNREDGIDINNECFNITIGDCQVGAGGRYAITIKGGSRVIVLVNVVITRPGAFVDIDIGNHSDQSWAKTIEVILINVTREDGEPVRVRVGRAEMPTIHGGNIKILWWQSVRLKAYVYAKHWFPWIK